jgi:hypothetical protein
MTDGGAAPPTIDIMAPTPEARPSSVDAQALVRGLAGVLAGLGLPDALAGSRRLLERADQLAAASWEAQRVAASTRAAALDGLVRGRGEVDLAELTDAVGQVSPWLTVDGAGAHEGPLVWTLALAARTCRAHAQQVLAAESGGVYARLQRLAAEVVAEVAALAPIDSQTWASPAPAARLIRAGREADWTTLLRTSDRFSEIHRAAKVLRGTGGLGAQALPPAGAIEPVCWELRNWREAQNRLPELRRIQPALRLLHCIRERWEPGLWTRDDLDRPAEAPKRGLLAALTGR